MTRRPVVLAAASFVHPTSGGLRTCLDAWGEGYAARGVDRVLVVPGPSDDDRTTSTGRVVAVRSPRLPRSGGYRLLLRRAPVRRLLDEVRPDRVEVHDRLALAWLGADARGRGVRSLVVSHERADHVARVWLPAPLPARRLAHHNARALARDFDVVVATTAWAAAEFDEAGAGAAVRVPLGVDLDRFGPHLDAAAVRARLLAGGAHGRADVLLVSAVRLSAEKSPGLVLDVAAELVRRGLRVRTVLAGSGPLEGRLRARASAERLDVDVRGWVERSELAVLLAAADVVLAPGPYETFALAGLEALASGTPLVVPASGALPELLADAPGAGAVGRPDGPGLADAVQDVLAPHPGGRAVAARAAAARSGWDTSVDAVLAAHDLEAWAGRGPGRDGTAVADGPVAARRWRRGAVDLRRSGGAGAAGRRPGPSLRRRHGARRADLRRAARVPPRLRRRERRRQDDGHARGHGPRPSRCRRGPLARPPTDR